MEDSQTPSGDSTPVDDEEFRYNENELRQMTVAKLRGIVEDEELEVPLNARKDEVISAIMALKDA